MILNLGTTSTIKDSFLCGITKARKQTNIVLFDNNNSTRKDFQSHPWEMLEIIWAESYRTVVNFVEVAFSRT
jgi:hypothetical protein